MLFSMLMIFSVFNGEHSLKNYFTLKKTKIKFEQRVAKLQSEVDDFQNEITKIKESKEYARKVLRDKYHTIDKNEKIVFFDD
jgi:cell division protein FtsB